MARILLTAWVALSYCLSGLTTAWHPHENELDSDQTHPINPKSPASKLHDEIDILKLTNISSKQQGVSLVEGPLAPFPAFKFRPPYTGGPLLLSALVAGALNASEGFTIAFVFRQQKGNLGALLSVNSPGRLTPWLELAVNSRTGELGLKYRLKGSPKLRQMGWGLPRHHRKAPLAAWTWLSLSVDYTTGIVRLDLDCEPSRFESLSLGADKSRISIPQDSLVYFRQEPGRKKKFLGSMQVAKVLPYVQQQRLWTCMEIGSNLPPHLRKPLL